MVRYGIVSISPNPQSSNLQSFELLYNAIGQNTGNLLFTNAVWRQLDAELTRLGFTFKAEMVNAELDAIVIPAANWINPSVDFSHVADVLEGVKIPIVVIGLGAQATVADASPGNIPEGTIRFLKLIADRSESMSVRGEYSAAALHRLGFRNARVTGCPSLYQQFGGGGAPRSTSFSLDRTLVHATRFSATHSAYAQNDTPDRRIARFAYSEGLDALFQSEPEELALLFGYESAAVFTDLHCANLRDIYGAESWHAARDFILSRGHSYTDIGAWAAAMQNYDFVVGTRLHGTIMALNAGAPACLLWHDARTKELAEFAAIPSADASRAEISERGFEGLHASADIAAYHKRRADNLTAYKDFLEENSLLHRLGDAQTPATKRQA